MIAANTAIAQAQTVEARIATDGLILSADVRQIVLRILRDPRADSDTLLLLSEALIEIGELADRHGLARIAGGYHAVARMLADFAARRAG